MCGRVILQLFGNSRGLVWNVMIELAGNVVRGWTSEFLPSKDTGPGPLEWWRSCALGLSLPSRWVWMIDGWFLTESALLKCARIE